MNGQFGENFTIEGLPDDKGSRIGDRYQIGSAVFEVTAAPRYLLRRP